MTRLGGKKKKEFCEKNPRCDNNRLSASSSAGGPPPVAENEGRFLASYANHTEDFQKRSRIDILWERVGLHS